MQHDTIPGRRPAHLPLFAILTPCLLVLACPAALFGQGPVEAMKPKAAPKPSVLVPKIVTEPVVTAAKIDAKIKQIEANAMLKKEVKDQVLKLYNDAKEELKAAEDFQKKLADYESLRNNVGKLTKDVQAEIDKQAKEFLPALPDNPKLSDYEALLTAAEAKRDKAHKAWKELDAEPKRRLDRETENPKRLEAARKELKVLLAAKPAANEPPETADAQKVFRLARQQALQAEIKALEAELPTYKATHDLLQLQITAARRRFDEADKLVKDRKEDRDKKRVDDANREVQKALKRSQEQPNDALAALAKENLNLAARRTGPIRKGPNGTLDGTLARIEQADQELDSRKKDVDQLEKDYKSLVEKLDVEGIEDVIGPELLRLRLKLQPRNVGKLQRDIAERRRELSELYREILSDNEQLSEVDTKLAEEKKNPSKQVRNTLEERQKLLRALANDHNLLYGKLIKLNFKELDLINQTRKLQQLIDKHLLWMPSTEPLGLDERGQPDGGKRDLKNTGDALLWLVSADDWKNTWDVLKASVLARPIISAFFVFLLALVLLKETRIKQHLRDAGEQAARGFTEPYTLTLKALVLTLLLAAVWPCVLGFIGWRIETYADTIPEDAAKWPRAVANSLQAVAVVLFTLDFLRRMLRHHGLAEAHFRWRDARMQMFRSNLRWFAVLVLPGVFVLTMVEEWENQEYSSSLGRLMLMGQLLVGSAFLALVLRRPRKRTPITAAALDHTIAVKKAHFLRIAAYVVAVLFPLALAILAGMGYLYTAWLLTWKLTETAWLSIGLVVTHAMAMRWLYHARGRLALDRVQEAAATAAAVAASTETTAKPEASTSGPADDPRGDGKLSEEGATPNATSVAGSENSATAAAADRELKQKTAAEIATINAQTKRLLRMAIGAAAVIGLWLIWRDVLPALEFLQAPIMPSHIDGLTWGAAIVAVAVLVISFIAATNLPGLLEVAVLQKLPIDSGARYAASTTVRYLIYTIGIVWGFNIAGIDWSKIQWLVAALGVGIGFGLQDIVANFISGLILLFERPLRVGDIITVGDVTGTVTRIQIRATTVRNWDQQEYVIPNKDLTTGRFINWTLSDTTNRVEIKVGVAYGSDPDLVQRILLDSVKGCPDILDNPPPHALFDGFGDSSLNFVLRCCLPSLDKRLPAMHYLHSEIHSRLAKAGIEIPFPQRDLHIRSDDTRGNGTSNGKQRKRETADDYESASFS
jgi:potassium-dependent mechanosensitive channel